MPTHEEDIIEECRKKTRQQTQTLSSSFESCGVGSQLLCFFALPKMRTLNDVCLSNVGVFHYYSLETRSLCLMEMSSKTIHQNLGI